MNNPKISIILIYNNNTEIFDECIKSIRNQTFSDIEIVCINNGSINDSLQSTITTHASEDKRIKLISLPIENELQTVKRIGLGTASGEFVYFIDKPEILDSDCAKNLYLSIASNAKIDIKSNYLYRRNYLENDKEISQLIEDKVQNALNGLNNGFISKENEIKELYNNFTKTNIEAINNANYELVQRFNQLEKLFYDKDWEYKKIIEEYSKNVYQDVDNKIQKVYEDISKIYEFINSEINKKGCEINNVYGEITNNYKYTEQTILQNTDALKQELKTIQETTLSKLNELEKEIIVRYVNLKRLLDMHTDETDSKLKALNPSDLSCFKNAVDNISIEKVMSDNMEKIYSHINKTSSLFYEELTKVYKELNDKIVKNCQDNE